jgi:hypothetical protein
MTVLDTVTMKPGVGAGDLLLRSSPHVVTAQLGAPERTDVVGDDEMWSFPSRHLTLTFERDGDTQQLASIGSRDPEVRIANTPVIDRAKNELGALYHIRGFGHPTSETDGIVEDLIFAEAGLVLSLYDGRVEEVTVSLPASLAGKSRERAFAPDVTKTTKPESGCLTIVIPVAFAILALLTIG